MSLFHRNIILPCILKEKFKYSICFNGKCAWFSRFYVNKYFQGYHNLCSTFRISKISKQTSSILMKCFSAIRLKKNTLSQSLREFFKPARHAFFYFIIFFTSIGLCLHAHPKPKMTEKFQLPYFQKSKGILHVFWAPTCLNSSKTANFLRCS